MRQFLYSIIMADYKCWFHLHCRPWEGLYLELLSVYRLTNRQTECWPHLCQKRWMIQHLARRSNAKQRFCPEVISLDAWMPSMRLSNALLVREEFLLWSVYLKSISLHKLWISCLGRWISQYSRCCLKVFCTLLWVELDTLGSTHHALPWLNKHGPRNSHNDLDSQTDCWFSHECCFIHQHCFYY